VPDAELRLVGLSTDGAAKPGGPDIHGLGYLESAAEEMATWSAMIVPIHEGAGTRVKIADAFSKGIPVVATELGASGYSIKNHVELLIADAPEDFAAAC